MLRWLLLSVLLALLSFGFSLAYRLGAFKSPTFTVAEESILFFVYKEHIGPYHKIVGTIEEVEAWAKGKGITCTRTYGEFLDNPEVIDEARLRSHCGCVLDDAQAGAMSLPEGFHFEERPAQKYIKVTFEGSPSIGPFKVYSQVKEMATNQRMTLGTSNFEIYDIHQAEGSPDSSKADSMTTTYLFPINAN